MVLLGFHHTGPCSECADGFLVDPSTDSAATSITAAINMVEYMDVAAIVSSYVLRTKCWVKTLNANLSRCVCTGMQLQDCKTIKLMVNKMDLCSYAGSRTAQSIMHAAPLGSLGVTEPHESGLTRSRSTQHGTASIGPACITVSWAG